MGHIVKTEGGGIGVVINPSDLDILKKGKTLVFAGDFHIAVSLEDYSKLSIDEIFKQMSILRDTGRGYLCAGFEAEIRRRIAD